MKKCKYRNLASLITIISKLLPDVKIKHFLLKMPSYMCFA